MNKHISNIVKTTAVISLAASMFLTTACGSESSTDVPKQTAASDAIVKRTGYLIPGYLSIGCTVGSLDKDDSTSLKLVLATDTENDYPVYTTGKITPFSAESAVSPSDDTEESSSDSSASDKEREEDLAIMTSEHKIGQLSAGTDTDRISDQDTSAVTGSSISASTPSGQQTENGTDKKMHYYTATVPISPAGAIGTITFYTGTPDNYSKVTIAVYDKTDCVSGKESYLKTLDKAYNDRYGKYAKKIKKTKKLPATGKVKYYDKAEKASLKACKKLDKMCMHLEERGIIKSRRYTGSAYEVAWVDDTVTTWDFMLDKIGISYSPTVN